jgi:hypothetical protein
MRQPTDQTLANVPRAVVPVDAEAMSEARQRQAQPTEAAGALLAFPLVEAAGATLRELEAFDSAGVAKKEHRDG